MAVITIAEAAMAMRAVESVLPKLKNPKQYELKKVAVILQQSIDLARPLVTGDEQKDQWLNIATTLPFEPLVFKDVFKGIKISPEAFHALKKLCV
jgi:hypothetical protein